MTSNIIAPTSKKVIIEKLLKINEVKSLENKKSPRNFQHNPIKFEVYGTFDRFLILEEIL